MSTAKCIFEPAAASVRTVYLPAFPAQAHLRTFPASEHMQVTPVRCSSIPSLLQLWRSGVPARQPVLASQIRLPPTSQAQRFSQVSLMTVVSLLHCMFFGVVHCPLYHSVHPVRGGPHMVPSTHAPFPLFAVPHQPQLGAAFLHSSQVVAAEQEARVAVVAFSAKPTRWFSMSKVTYEFCMNTSPKTLPSLDVIMSSVYSPD
mmetsp:Transcript_25985/g.65951  ORF Transcript_25985/g.65951 Transcript_25985/m.65951 type:complete len:202 (-) Transcript_25985:1430-2035(-)